MVTTRSGAREERQQEVNRLYEAHRARQQAAFNQQMIGIITQSIDEKNRLAAERREYEAQREAELVNALRGSGVKREPDGNPAQAQRQPDIQVIFAQKDGEDREAFIQRTAGMIRSLQDRLTSGVVSYTTSFVETTPQ